MTNSNDGRREEPGAPKETNVIKSSNRLPETTVRYLENFLDWHRPSIQATTRVFAAYGGAILVFAFKAEPGQRIFRCFSEDPIVGAIVLSTTIVLIFYQLWFVGRNYNKAQIACTALCNDGRLNAEIAELMRITGRGARRSRLLLWLIPIAGLVSICTAILWPFCI